MIGADVIVMATPVYFAPERTNERLIDRTYPRHLEMSNKGTYFIMTAAAASKQAMERTLDGFRAFTCLLRGAKEKGVTYGTGGRNAGGIKGSEAMKQTYEMGKTI